MQYDEIFEDTHLLELFNFGICVLDEELNVKYWNSWLSFSTKIDLESIKNNKLNEVFPDINASKLKRQIKAANRINSPTYFTGKEGYLFPVKVDEITNPFFEYMQQQITIYPLSNNNVLLTLKDQTSLKEATIQLKESIRLLEEKKKLYMDKLTSLPNRNQLIEDIEAGVNRKLALLNITGFTEINDFYGFSVGDLYLKFIASELDKLLDSELISLYKLPADEYAIFSCCEKLTNEKFQNIVEDVVKKIEHMIYEDDQDNQIAIYLSAGISFNATNIFKTADIALKKSKKQKQDVVVYDDSINIEKQVQEKHKWLKILKDALLNDRIKAFYQPIYNIKTKKIEKYETLVRLIDCDGKVISPFFFLEISKNAKMYNEITSRIVHQSFEKFKDSDYEFSINISVEDIEHVPTYELIINKLKENPSIAKRLVVELLEDEGIENFDLVNQFIQDVKSNGAKVAIDDFGTGYSNFSYLLELDIDYLKIDASLIKNIHIDPNSKKIVETLVEFSKKINVKTIGEFVHNQEVLDEITKQNIDYAQGFYVDQPREEIGGEPIWKE